MVRTELHSQIPLQGTKRYIPLEWACCLLVATATSWAIENHRFLWWICSTRLKRTMEIPLITGRSFGNFFYLWSCSLSQRSRLWGIRSNVSPGIESDITCTKVSDALLMALLREKVIQRTNSDYLDKHWKTSTFSWLQQILSKSIYYTSIWLT